MRHSLASQLLAATLLAAAPLSAQIAEPDPSQPPTVVVAFAEATAPTNLWIGGGFPNEIWRWNGTAMRYLPIPEALHQPNVIEELSSLSVVSPTVAYFGGKSGSLWRYSGQRYERLTVLPPQITSRILVHGRSATEFWVVSEATPSLAGYLWVPDSANPGQLIPKEMPFKFEISRIAPFGRGVIISGYASESSGGVTHGVLISYENGRFTSHGWSPTNREAPNFTRRALGVISTNGQRTLVHFYLGGSLARSSTALVSTDSGWRPIAVLTGVQQYAYAVAPDGRIVMMGSKGLQTVDTTIFFPDTPAISPPPRGRIHFLFPFTPAATLVVEGEVLVRYTRTTRTVLARLRLP